MSQYPSPYVPPDQTPYGGPGFTPYIASASTPESQLRAAARRAGLMLIIVSALMVVCGGGWFIMSLIPLQKILPPEQITQMQKMQGSNRPLTEGFRIRGIIIVAVAIVALILGLFVRRASRPAILTSMILVGLAIVLIALNMLGLFAAPGGLMPTGALIGSFIILAILLALAWILFKWLLVAWRNGSAIQTLRQNYQDQMAQYQQRQQFFGQGQSQQTPSGYAGYGAGSLAHGPVAQTPDAPHAPQANWPQQAQGTPPPPPPVSQPPNPPQPPSDKP